MATYEGFNRFNHFARGHQTLTPHNSTNFQREFIIFCGSAGTISAVDTYGTAITYTVLAGDILPVLCKRVNATGTTVTPVIGLY